jgi:hypothetical protein
MAPALAQRLGQLFLRMTESGHQLPEAQRLFDGVQIGALDVLDDRDFQHFRIVKVPHYNGNFVQLRQLRRPPRRSPATIS